ncbi:MAG: hypothetical protein M2R45_02221 [Verrucomicrobia subdivision 3 bacterium]|nr:hypothetical protein [Limisphaerales bacterium]MCS1413994.1 hypothetical protein [Limisphaerales bacterium]
MNVPLSSLHHYIIQHLVEVGYAPKVAHIADHFQTDAETAGSVLQSSETDHGVVFPSGIQGSMYQGAVQSIEKIWESSKVCYGNHLRSNWTKWTIDEARQLFTVNSALTHRIWTLPQGQSQF